MSAFASTIRREFLGWNQPALPAAARSLAARFRQGQQLNLSRIIVVVPGQRAGRRLQELLAFLAEDEHWCLTPPKVTTEGKLPEMLYPPQKPFANDLVQDLAWSRALRELPTDTRRHVVPHPPADADAPRWLALGKVLRNLHHELAADGLDFSSVLKSGPKLSDFREVDRWQALFQLQVNYLALLDQQQLWDIQTARLKAIEFREIQTDCDIILLGTVDLNNTLRKMLDQVANRVTAYIVAPRELADHFDAHGCLTPELWSAAPIPLQDEQLCQVDGPEEQADAVTDWLAQVAAHRRHDEVAIGVPDEALVPQLQRQLEQCGVKARWVEGTRLAETAPYRLLSVAVEYAGRWRYEDLAALLRHPDVEDWLRRELHQGALAESLPAQLDRFYNSRLPSRVRFDPALANAEKWPDLTPALERIEGWIANASGNFPLRAWGELFRNILGAVYGQRTLNLDDPAQQALHRTLRKLLEVCERLADVPALLDTNAISAADAFYLAFGPLGDEFLPPPADPDAVEILGWLELPLDDSPALVVTSFNEGFVPKSAVADAFLPDRLRRELNLLHNDRRYARDAYATSVLCRSRPELRVLFARRDTQQDPLHPSRLLFACPDAQLVARAGQFFEKSKAAAPSHRLLLAPQGGVREESLFKPPRPLPTGTKPERIPVTHFREYLACPYRYYLRRIQKLKAMDDAAREMDGGAFGTLLHRVLGAFGRDRQGPRQSTREWDVCDYLAARLDDFAKAVYGADQRRPAIRLQIEQARLRLLAFASRQVELVRAGWCIAYVEDDDTKAELTASFPPSGQVKLITLVGRIDRIDYHESNRIIRILDYKTADSDEPPDKTHRRKGQWIDLQLPLYRHIWPQARPKAEVQVPKDCAVELGYFNLPKSLDATQVCLADWNADLLNKADDEACRVIRGILDRQFWPPAEKAPKYSEDFAAICLDNVRGAPALDDDGQGGDA